MILSVIPYTHTIWSSAAVQRKRIRDAVVAPRKQCAINRLVFIPILHCASTRFTWPESDTIRLLINQESTSGRRTRGRRLTDPTCVISLCIWIETCDAILDHSLLDLQPLGNVRNQSIELVSRACVYNTRAIWALSTVTRFQKVGFSYQRHFTFPLFLLVNAKYTRSSFLSRCHQLQLDWSSPYLNIFWPDLLQNDRTS